VRNSGHPIRTPLFLDVSNKLTYFLKQEHENGFTTIRAKIELDVPKKVQMSQAKGIDVLCNNDVLGDIKKTQLYYVQRPQKHRTATLTRGFVLTLDKLVKVTMD